MGYDCSITVRKGCNYCLKRKTVMSSEIGFKIDDENKELRIFYDNGDGCTGSDQFAISFCPVCGKQL